MQDEACRVKKYEGSVKSFYLLKKFYPLIKY